MINRPFAACAAVSYYAESGLFPMPWGFHVIPLLFQSVGVLIFLCSLSCQVMFIVFAVGLTVAECRKAHWRLSTGWFVPPRVWTNPRGPTNLVIRLYRGNWNLGRECSTHFFSCMAVSILRLSNVAIGALNTLRSTSSSRRYRQRHSHRSNSLYGRPKFLQYRLCEAGQMITAQWRYVWVIECRSVTWGTRCQKNSILHLFYYGQQRVFNQCIHVDLNFLGDEVFYFGTKALNRTSFEFAPSVFVVGNSHSSGSWHALFVPCHFPEHYQ